MKLLAILGFAILTAASFGQMGGPPPKELELVDFLSGNWEAKKVTYHMGGQTAEGSARTVTTRALNGRFIHSLHYYTMPGSATEFQGLMMLSYDPAKKVYVGYWFDPESPEAMQVTGDFKDNKLTLTSKPTKMEGMGEVVMRPTFTKQADGTVKFVLEMMGEDKKWAPMMECVFSKSPATK